MIDAAGADPVRIEVQNAAGIKGLPGADSFCTWAGAALRSCGRSLPGRAVLTIRIVDEEESGRLNSSFRNVSRPTNVLAFPAPAEIFGANQDDDTELGDLAICAPVVLREAEEQAKRPLEHFAHMTVHGVLHLVGYDHGNPDEAGEMESLEKQVLAELGYPDPYRDENNDISQRQA